MCCSVVLPSDVGLTTLVMKKAIETLRPKVCHFSTIQHIYV